MRAIALLLLTIPVLADTDAAQPLDQDALLARITATLNRREAEFTALRHDLHRNPEVSGNEVRTSARVAATLRTLGLEVTTDVGGHGVVGILRGGRAGPLLAYRADMDAVRTNDPDPVDYRSLIPGVRHICGHDIHTTVALALATAFAEVRNELAGSVMFIFQPAEETAVGARAMLAAGLFAREKPVAIYGVHTAPYEVGTVATRSGGMMASRDLVRIELSGTGDLTPAARAARQLLSSLSTITEAQQFQPAASDFAFVQMNPDATANSRITVSAQITLASDTTRAQLQQRIARAIPSLGSSTVTATHYYHARQIPGVSNDPSTTTTAITALRRVHGDAALRPLTSVTPAFSEDFGAYQEQVPGTFLFVGVSNSARGWMGMPHSPDHVADDAAIVFAARAVAAVLLDRMGRVGSPDSRAPGNVP